jgi:hypothetical protein
MKWDLFLSDGNLEAISPAAFENRRGRWFEIEPGFNGRSKPSCEAVHKRLERVKGRGGVGDLAQPPKYIAASLLGVSGAILCP